MNKFALKTFTLNKPMKLGGGDPTAVSRSEGLHLYRPHSHLVDTAYGSFFPNGKRAKIITAGVRSRAPRVALSLESRERLGTIRLEAYNLITGRGYFISTIKEVKGMARFRKKQISWDPVDSADIVGYKVYWAVGGGVNYESDFSEVGLVTEVVLPDDVPSFPLVADDIEIGVTAVSHKGNESDMTVFSAPFDFTAPPAPSNLMVKDL